MGLDFIHNTPGKPWQKAWNAGLDALKRPSLFDIQISEERRVITVDCNPGIALKEGVPIVLQIVEAELVVLDGIQTVGRTNRVPQDVLEALNEASGVACGVVERVGQFGDIAEIRILP